jgi:uncharacterized protein
MLALLDASEHFHPVYKRIYEENVASWVLPSATLPEVDYLVSKYLGDKAQNAFLADLADERFSVEWCREEDLAAAHGIAMRHKGLRIGFVDAMVIAVTERLRADAIATLDMRHFAAVSIKGNPLLLPRDQ